MKKQKLIKQQSQKNHIVSKEEKSTALLSHHRGPLPSPKNLGEYENVISGAADRIITMAENRQSHLSNMESNKQKHIIKLLSHGQYMAYSLGILGILGTVYLAAIGLGWESGFAGLFGIASIISQVRKQR